VVPGLYLAALLFLAVVLLIEKPLYTTAGLVIVALGIPVYFIWRRTASRA
jgi:APA family basic amino acid/polyamine antiporter